MEKFGFSAGLIAKIRVLYSETESVLKFNGNFFASCLSGMLYALSPEPLLQKICRIQGLILPGDNTV